MREYNLREYVRLEEITGPIFIIRNIQNVGNNEIVEVVDDEGK